MGHNEEYKKVKSQSQTIFNDLFHHYIYACTKASSEPEGGIGSPGIGYRWL